jgi:hypothetical protein
MTPQKSSQGQPSVRPQLKRWAVLVSGRLTGRNLSCVFARLLSFPKRQSPRLTLRAYLAHKGKRGLGFAVAAKRFTDRKLLDYLFAGDIARGSAMRDYRVTQ